MTKREARKLKNGIYRIIWKNGGGRSIAAVGHDDFRNAWTAPIDWIKDIGGIDHWWDVEKVELLAVAIKKEG